MRQLCILTVVDTLSTTSMPVNEFVLYRHRCGFPFRQILMVFADSKEPFAMPDDIETLFIGGRTGCMRKELKKIRKSCEERGERLVCHLHAQKSAMAFFWASRGMGLRRHTLYTIHSSFGSRDLKYRLTSCLCTLLARKANCVSESAFQQYQPLIRRLKSGDMLTITNGVDIERIDRTLAKIENSASNSDEDALVCVGRIIPIKNQAFLIRLLPLLPSMRLVLVGAESDSYPVHALAEELGVADRVVFTGMIPREEVFRKLTESRFFVSASTVEGLPVSVLEAMAVGLIPVISDIPPHREIAARCGFECIGTADPKAWVFRILNLRNLGAGLDRLSTQIKETVREHYSLTAMHEQYQSIYEQLAE